METKKRDFIDLLKSFRDYYGIRHHHKEVLVWFTTLLFLAISSTLLLRTGIIETLHKDLSNFLFISLFFTIIFALFFTFLFWQFRQREIANNTVLACTNLISRIFENERMKLDLKKGDFHGAFWPKVLINEYRAIKDSHRVIGSEVISYSIVWAFYLGVLTKIMWSFFG
ncbi:MAG: hypothetical protein JSV25_15445 [Spirochaetota bacterium]|nr:MAG: hypothetical protein JSV25_15445 [Spirochaetota bacterium]